MEARKWEELPIECLVNVFGRVGVGSLLVEIPFICKPWYKATLSPLCWKQLDFAHISDYYYSHDSFIGEFTFKYRLRGEISVTKLLKFAVDRSAGGATMVGLLDRYTEEALAYVADKCPALKKLEVHSEKSSMMSALSVVVGKLKYLESLKIRADLYFKVIVNEISANCPNFVDFSLVAATKVYIGEEEAMTIINCLPKIKFLALRDVYIKRETLIKILKGCVELVHLDVRDCCGRGITRFDEELLKLASHIPTFLCSSFYQMVSHSDSDSDDYD